MRCVLSLGCEGLIFKRYWSCVYQRERHIDGKLVIVIDTCWSDLLVKQENDFL